MREVKGLTGKIKVSNYWIQCHYFHKRSINIQTEQFTSIKGQTAIIDWRKNIKANSQNFTTLKVAITIVVSHKKSWTLKSKLEADDRKQGII